VKTPQNKLEDGEYIYTHEKKKQTNSHYRYKQTPTIITTILNTQIATKKIQGTPKELIIKNVIINYDMKPNTMAHIKDSKSSNSPDYLYTKPKTQPIKTVGIESTVAASGKSAITPTRNNNTTPLPPGK
jgi:hypothetical protein